jgi:hypothetical protein
MMNEPVLWSLDETRRVQPEVIARKLKLKSYVQGMNRAIDEFIVRHGTPTQLNLGTQRKT